MKILSVVIVYFPEIELLQDNVRRFIDDVDNLIVWDNTPGGTDKLAEIFSSFDIKYPKKIKYMGDGVNHYIAYPLNKVLEYALAGDYTHLLTMDQDSLFENGHFKSFLNIVQEYSNDKTIAMFGVNPNSYYPLSTTPIEIGEVITSGTIYSLNVFKKIGSFREDLKIDGVDTEICFRARRIGLKTMIIASITLHQLFGKTDKKLGYSIDNYSVFRIYQIIRNHIILWKEYPEFFKKNRYSFIRYNIVFRIPKIIFHEDNKLQKLKAVFWGVVDGILNRKELRSIK